MSDVIDLKEELLLLHRENKELRELVRHMNTCMEYTDENGELMCSQCPCNYMGNCDFECRMHELGVTA